MAGSGIGASISLFLELKFRGTVALSFYFVSHPLAHVVVRIIQPRFLPVILCCFLPESRQHCHGWVWGPKGGRVKETHSAVDMEVMEASTNHHTALLWSDRVARVGDTIWVAHDSVSFTFIELSHLASWITRHWWVVVRSDETTHLARGVGLRHPGSKSELTSMEGRFWIAERSTGASPLLSFNMRGLVQAAPQWSAWHS